MKWEVDGVEQEIEGGNETEEEMEGGEEEAYLPFAAKLAAGAAREKQHQRRCLPREEESAMRAVSPVPGVRWCGSLLAWIRGDWVGSRTNPGIAKCIFWASGGITPRVGLIQRVTGFWADSTANHGYPNEALRGWGSMTSNHNRERLRGSMEVQWCGSE
jgi:hypothetical protein